MEGGGKAAGSKGAEVSVCWGREGVDSLLGSRAAAKGTGVGAEGTGMGAEAFTYRGKAKT